MRSVVTWQETRTDPRDGTRAVVWDIAFKPDGSQLIAAVGSRVVVYDAIDGTVLHQLRGHKDTVHCVAYSRDGKRFASGGADNTVIIWTSKAEGMLKYTHNDKIQCLTYNPVTAQLTSCTASDFGMWSPEQKSVTKHRVTGRVNAASWTGDGQVLAIGQHNGVVSLRGRDGKLITEIQRNGPVWCLQWSPDRASADVLAVGSWDGTLGFFDVAGKPKGKDRALDFDPCSLGYYANGEYLVVGGSDGKAALYTAEGVRLNTIVERPDWVWACKPRPTGNFVAFGANDGSIGMCQLVFSTVHGLYQERYAYRDKMTNVNVQHLITEQSVTLKLKDYVKKIAIYKDRLAVQIPDKIIVYELRGGNEYHVQQVIQQKVDCNLLVVTAQHLMLCQERRLQLLDFSGAKVREWVLEAVIRYIKVVGGPTGREGLVVGLKNGSVYKVFVDNPFPVLLIQQGLSIRCLDLSRSRRMLAVVDENSECSVYNLDTKELISKEHNANSVAWNTELEDMLCFSGNGLLSIKTGPFPATTQKLTGFVVGFKGAKVFCLHYVSMQTVDIPQSASMYRYIDVKDFEAAHRVACLGVTDSDWRVLATEALANMNFEVARKAFIRTRDIRYIDLLNSIEAQRRADGPGTDTQQYLADIYAYQGKYQDAARIYVKCGQVNKAIDMLTALRKYKEAQEFARQSGVNVSGLLHSQAEWLEEDGDLVAAAQMYSAGGDHARAIRTLGERKRFDELLELARSLDKNDAMQHLRACADYMRAAGRNDAAEEIVRKMGDERALLEIHVENRNWPEAFRLVEANPSLDASKIHLPYAYWLAENDRFEEAQAAFARAGVPEKALDLLENLTRNAVVESRFADAARYFFTLSTETLVAAGRARASGDPAAAIARSVTRADEYYKRAEVYFAYSYLHRHTVNPFTELQPESLFNVSTFLVNSTSRAAASGGGAGASGSASGAGSLATVPLGVSRVNVLNALSQTSTQLGAHKLARTAFVRLSQLRVPDAWAEKVELASIAARGRPFTDDDAVSPTCMRCGATNPILNVNGDRCVVCGHGFQRSFGGSFEHVPVIEFVPADGIDDAAAMRFIEQEPLGPRAASGIAASSSTTRTSGGADVMTLGGGGGGGDGGGGDDGGDLEDPFTVLLRKYEQGDAAAGPLVCDRDTLVRIPSNEVYVKQWPGDGVKRNEYFRTMLPEIPITLCDNCNHFFSQEDYEASVLEQRCCPFCKTPVKHYV